MMKLFIWLGWSVNLGCYFCLLMCLTKDHGFEPKPEKAEKFYRFEVDQLTIGHQFLPSKEVFDPHH